MNKDLADFEVVEWLHESWGPSYWGWSLNESDTQQGVILRVPPYFFVGHKRIDTNEEQRLLNKYRIPVKSQNLTVTMDLTSVEAMFWDKGSLNWDAEKNVVKESLNQAPKYFYLLELLMLGSLEGRILEVNYPAVYEIWPWENSIDINTEEVFIDGIPE